MLKRVVDWTAITGIVVSGVLGPGAGAWWSMRRLRREHDYAIILVDRAELRSLLDEAERDMQRFGKTAAALQDMLLRYGVTVQQRAPEHFDRFREWGRAADLHAGRLALRLAEDALVATSYRAAFDAVVKITDALEAAVAQGGRADLLAAGNAMQQAAEKFEAAHERFLGAANALARSRLDGST